MITPVENGSTSRARASQHRRDGGARGLGRRDTGVARAGIGVAGVDDERANTPVTFEMPPADDDRRRAKAVLREYAGGDGARVEGGEEQIVALPPLDLRGDGAEPHARDRQQLGRRRAACSGRASDQRLLKTSARRKALRAAVCLSCQTRARSAARDGTRWYSEGRARTRQCRRPHSSSTPADRGIACISCRDPQGHGSFRPTFPPARTNGGAGRRRIGRAPRRAPHRSPRADT